MFFLFFLCFFCLLIAWDVDDVSPEPVSRSATISLLKQKYLPRLSVEGNLTYGNAHVKLEESLPFLLDGLDQGYNVLSAFHGSDVALSLDVYCTDILDALIDVFLDAHEVVLEKKQGFDDHTSALRKLSDLEFRSIEENLHALRQKDATVSLINDRRLEIVNSSKSHFDAVVSLASPPLVGDAYCKAMTDLNNLSFLRACLPDFPLLCLNDLVVYSLENFDVDEGDMGVLSRKVDMLEGFKGSALFLA